jgi:hypothetical protein
VDKSFIVEIKQAVDLFLRAAHVRLADVVWHAILVERNQVERSGAFSTRTTPDDLINQLFLLEFEQDVHVVLPHMDEFLVTAGTGFAPERPGDRVEQRRLACAIRSGEAGKVNAIKAHRVGRTVGKKILDL